MIGSDGKVLDRHMKGTLKTEFTLTSSNSLSSFMTLALDSKLRKKGLVKDDNSILFPYSPYHLVC